MRERRSSPSHSDVVSASEIASFVYCPEQWRLQYALGNEPENVESLARGEELHRRTARLDVWSRTIVKAGIFLLGIAVIGAVVLLRSKGWHP